MSIKKSKLLINKIIRIMTNKKILVVEDETDILDVLTDTFKREGAEVFRAEDGDEGLKIALAEKPDVILLDIIMPKVSGLDMLRDLRKDDWGKAVPVILLTNLSATEEKIIRSIVEYRPVFYLVKSDWKIADVVKKVKGIIGE